MNPQLSSSSHNSKSALPRVVVTRAVPGNTGSVDAAELVIGGPAAPTREELLAMVRGASVIVSMFSDSVDQQLLDAAGPSLAGVVNFASGYDNIDLQACRNAGVAVVNTPDGVIEGTANMAMTLLLAVSRRLLAADAFVRDRSWERDAPLSMSDFIVMDLAGRTMHIIGAGGIGSAMARRARAFGMEIIYTSRSPKPAMESVPISARRIELEAGLRLADVVSLHVPLTGETRHLLDAPRLGLLKDSAIVINTSRGAVIDEAALVDALVHERIFGAGLDVFEREPLLADRLRECTNVVLTPHIGSAELRWRAEMTRLCLEAAADIVAGREPRNRIC